MESDPVLCHFGAYSLDAPFWALPDDERAETASELTRAVSGVGEAAHLYGTFGTRPEADLLAWTAVRASSAAAAAGFFESLARALRPFRRYVRLVDALWGLTRVSEYARGGSDRALDPMKPRDGRYLVVYPFAKTPAWFRLEADERRRMMSEHMRIGRAHASVRQLLLYSAGLQDHEFVVVYETDDLADFSVLVHELRSTEARGYTLLDAPVRVGFHRAPDASGPWP